MSLKFLRFMSLKWTHQAHYSWINSTTKIKCTNASVFPWLEKLNTFNWIYGKHKTKEKQMQHSVINMDTFRASLLWPNCPGQWEIDLGSKIKIEFQSLVAWRITWKLMNFLTFIYHWTSQKTRLILFHSLRPGNTYLSVSLVTGLGSGLVAV